MIEIREALRAWLAGKSERVVAAQAPVLTARPAGGMWWPRWRLACPRGGGEEQLTDELIGQVVVGGARRCARTGTVRGGRSWRPAASRSRRESGSMAGGVPVVKIGILLGAKQGVVVAERTLHRFAVERCGGGKGDHAG